MRGDERLLKVTTGEDLRRVEGWLGDHPGDALSTLRVGTASTPTPSSPTCRSCSAGSGRPPERSRGALRRRRDRPRAHRCAARRRRARRYRFALPLRRAALCRRLLPRLLAEAYAQVRAAGWRLVNADCVLIGEAPRIAEHRAAMRARLQQAVGEGEVNVRATTTDGLRLHRTPRRSRGAGGRAARACRRLSRQRRPAVERPDDETVSLERRERLGVIGALIVRHRE